MGKKKATVHAIFHKFGYVEPQEIDIDRAILANMEGSKNIGRRVNQKAGRTNYMLRPPSERYATAFIRD